ncbi:hypothetical protein VIBNISO65_700040 [Vibrio nigripulchritudo SO65]|nr:hypothetical protein VIBNISO65_700040 [Vibrio nigripulchritudo SO65]
MKLIIQLIDNKNKKFNLDIRNYCYVITLQIYIFTINDGNLRI